MNNIQFEILSHKHITDTQSEEDCIFAHHWIENVGDDDCIALFSLISHHLERIEIRRPQSEKKKKKRKENHNII